MSINSISGISNSPTASPVQGGFRSAMKQAMSAVADKLGMSVTDLQAQLKSGKSLTDVAGAKGISVADLLATIKQSLSNSGTSDSALDVLANRIANHKGGHHHPAGAQGISGTQAGQTASSATSTSGVDTDGDNDGR